MVRDAGYHTGIVEMLILNGMFGLISTVWLLWVVILPGEYGTVLITHLLAFRLALYLYCHGNIHNYHG